MKGWSSMHRLNLIQSFATSKLKPVPTVVEAFSKNVQLILFLLINFVFFVF